MDIALPLLAALLGLLISPLLVAISVRVFDDTAVLVTWADLRRPMATVADVASTRQARWRLSVTSIITSLTFAPSRRLSMMARSALIRLA